MSRLVKHQDVRLESGSVMYPCGSHFPALSAAACEEAGLPPGASLAGSEMQDSLAMAQRIAQNIRVRAEAEAKNDRAEASRTGYEEGFRQGLEEANRQQRQASDELIAILTELDRRKIGILQSHETELRELALAIAQKVIDDRLTTDDAAFLRIFQKAVKEFGAQEWVKLTVSDYIVPFATAHSQMLLSMAEGAQRIEITSAEGAPKGTCIVETPEGIVDASVVTQMENLKKTFIGA